jgi:TonB-linked SusC/RagA family outer membrane protein
MKKISLLLAFFVCIGINSLFAQNMQVTGTVTSGEDGSGIPGATIKVKGGTTGVVTDLDGKYTISVSPEATLVVSFVGLKTQEVAVAGQKLINVTLQSDVVGLDEVVVTSMGIKKADKAIGFASKTFKSSDISDAQSTNMMTSLAGKVTGVQISNSGGAGSSTKVVIRGYSSLSGSNQPLYVIDGIPMNNDFQGSDGSSRSVDYGNGANDVNPDDVESITVLKGASATALYGSRASNGVIMITTKRAKTSTKEVKVIYSGSYGISNVLLPTQTQDQWGQGWYYYDPAENGSWGPRYDGIVRNTGTPINLKTGQYDPNGVYQQVPYSYVKDNLKNFYDQGYEANNNISIYGGNGKTSFVLSYGNTLVDGIVPTSADKMNRNLISLRANGDYGKFTVDASVNYVRKDQNAVAAGQGESDGGATLYQELIQTPGNMNISSMKDLSNPYNNSDNYFTWYAANPYWVINNNRNNIKEDRIYGKIEVGYELFKGTRVIGRVGGDFANTQRKEHANIESFTPGSWSELGGKQETTGRYSSTSGNLSQLDLTTLLDFDYKVGADWTLKGQAGYNFNEIESKNINSFISGLIDANWYSLQNSGDKPFSEENYTDQMLYGVLGQFDLGFRDYWFLTLSARNDWSSTLPKGKNSYFYGGVNTSLLLTEALGIKNDVLSYWKVRVAVGQTGNDAAPYQTNNAYIPVQVPLGYGDLYMPLGGYNGLTLSNIRGNENLRPEITTEYEFGTDFRLFQNRIGFDFTFYNKTTKDQIISASLAPESKFTSKTLNVGKIQNRGIEASLSLTPIKTKDFSWDFVTNFTLNRSKVLELWDNKQQYLLTSAYDVYYYAEVGKPLGVFRVPKASVVPDTINSPYAGYTIVSSASGLPVIDPNQDQEVGSSEADYFMGFVNKFKYKNFTLSASIDYRQGGKFYSYTKQLNSFVGNATPTSFNYRQPFMVPHSVNQVGNTYVENSTPFQPSANMYYGVSDYYNNGVNRMVFESMVLDRTNVKLREVSLSYSFPSNMLTSTGIAGLDLTIYGRNLLIWTPKENNFVDPETSNFGNDLLSEFGEFGTGPSTRNYGVSLRVNF